MYHDFFGWVRLILLILLIVLFSIFCIRAENGIQMEQQEPKAATTATTPTEATEPQATEAPTETTIPETEPPATTEPPTEPPTEPLTEPEPIPTETVYPYTDKDLEYLALVIYQEAGGDMYSDDTRLKVGTVVMNRVADDRFPDNIFEVILQRGQYGRLFWTGPQWPSRRWNRAEAHAVERAYTIAERILNGERALPSDVVYQSEYIQGTEIVAHQGGFYFCR